MKYLFIEDQPEHLKPLTRELRDKRNEVVVARDLAEAWTWLQGGQQFTLVAIDLALDQPVPEFAAEFGEVLKALSRKGLGELPMSGQALGLRLWRERKARNVRYCYLSNHPQLWVPAIDAGDPEFKAARGAPAEVLLDKASLWQHNIEAMLVAATKVWDEKKWFA